MRPDFESSPVVTIVLLGAIVCLGAWLRLEDLGGESLWLDESASWIQSRGSFAELIAMTANDNYPPLHNILLFASMKVFGSDSEWVLRLPSALLGILNLVAIYWLGSMLGGRIAGLLAALILALSGFHIYYSQEARMYALLAFAATLYAASAFYFARSPDWWRAAFVALSGLILLYAHPFGALNWIALFGAVGFLILPTVSDARRAIWLWLVANGIAALGFVPWAIVLLRRVALVAGNFHPPWPTIDVVYAQLYPLLGGALGGRSAFAGCRPRIHTHPEGRGGTCGLGVVAGSRGLSRLGRLDAHVSRALPDRFSSGTRNAVGLGVRPPRSASAGLGPCCRRCPDRRSQPPVRQRAERRLARRRGPSPRAYG
jgi:hypothetical protein